MLAKVESLAALATQHSGLVLPGFQKIAAVYGEGSFFDVAHESGEATLIVHVIEREDVATKLDTASHGGRGDKGDEETWLARLRIFRECIAQAQNENGARIKARIVDAASSPAPFFMPDSRMDKPKAGEEVSDAVAWVVREVAAGRLHTCYGPKAREAKFRSPVWMEGLTRESLLAAWSPLELDGIVEVLRHWASKISWRQIWGKKYLEDVLPDRQGLMLWVLQQCVGRTAVAMASSDYVAEATSSRDHAAAASDAGDGSAAGAGRGPATGLGEGTAGGAGVDGSDGSSKDDGKDDGSEGEEHVELVQEGWGAPARPKPPKKKAKPLTLLWSPQQPDPTANWAAALASRSIVGGGGGGSAAEETERGRLLFRCAVVEAWLHVLQEGTRLLLTPEAPLHGTIFPLKQPLLKCPALLDAIRKGSALRALHARTASWPAAAREALDAASAAHVLRQHAQWNPPSPRGYWGRLPVRKAAELLEAHEVTGLMNGLPIEGARLVPEPSASELRQLAAASPASPHASLRELSARLKRTFAQVDAAVGMLGHAVILHAPDEVDDLAKLVLQLEDKLGTAGLSAVFRWPACGTLYTLDRLPWREVTTLHLALPQKHCPPTVGFHANWIPILRGDAPDPQHTSASTPAAAKARLAPCIEEAIQKSDRQWKNATMPYRASFDASLRITLPRAEQRVINESVLATRVLCLAPLGGKHATPGAYVGALRAAQLPTSIEEALARLADPGGVGLRRRRWQWAREALLVRHKGDEALLLRRLPQDIFVRVLEMLWDETSD